MTPGNDFLFSYFFYCCCSNIWYWLHIFVMKLNPLMFADVSHLVGFAAKVCAVKIPIFSNTTTGLVLSINKYYSYKMCVFTNNSYGTSIYRSEHFSKTMPTQLMYVCLCICWKLPIPHFIYCLFTLREGIDWYMRKLFVCL